MGRALVIDGLVVTNPLSTITLKNVNSILKEYYLTNTSVTESEKTALNTFVKGLIDANLWMKMKYFYPLLGGNVSDMVIDAVSPSTEDLFANAGVNGLSVSSRILIANTRNQVERAVGSRAKNLDTTKIGFICSGKADSWFGGGQLFNFNTNANTFGIDIATASSGNGYPVLTAKGTNIFSNTAYTTILERIIFGNIDNNVGSIYDNSSLLASSNVNVTGSSIASSYGVLSNYRSNNYKYNFFAITEGMTSADWLS